MKKVIPQLPTTNPLLDIHARLINFPIRFREQVCEECNWSIPTFYRKMRSVDKPYSEDSSKIIKAISNAEKEKIVSIVDEAICSLSDYIEQFRISK